MARIKSLMLGYQLIAVVGTYAPRCCWCLALV
jgi:hypothetical protein